MPRGSGGQYSKPSGTTAIPNTTIASGPYNALQDDMADALTDSLSRSGLGGMVAPLDMGGYAVTNLQDGSAPGDAATVGQVDALTADIKIKGEMKNKLINPLGTINQRSYVSGTATTGANQYTLDRWRVVTSGESLSWTESEGVRTMTAPAGGVEQIVEGGALLSGDYVLNWEGSATATVNGVARVKGEVFALTGGANAAIRFIDGTFALPQLERATSPTMFELRHPAQELMLCQRYYWHTFPPGTAPASNAGLEGSVYITQSVGPGVGVFACDEPFPVPMRATPSISTFNTSGAGNQIYCASVSAPWTGTAVSEVTSTRHVAIFGVTASGSGNGNSSFVHIAADAEFHS